MCRKILSVAFISCVVIMSIAAVEKELSITKKDFLTGVVVIRRTSDGITPVYPYGIICELLNKQKNELSPDFYGVKTCDYNPLTAPLIA